jgi:hypothetical protein
MAKLQREERARASSADEAQEAVRSYRPNLPILDAPGGGSPIFLSFFLFLQILLEKKRSKL